MEGAPIVFGTDGWRGLIARDLTFDAVRRVVTAAAAWTIDPANVEPGDPWTLPIVFDNRFLSPELAAESATLLASHGFRVLLADRPVPTPCASWHVASRGLRAGLAITASHNPALWNGVKVKSSFGGSATPDTYEAIARAVDTPLPGKAGGSVETLDLATPYRHALAELVDLDAIRGAGLRVLFDAIHGAAGTLLESIVGTGHPTTVVSLRTNRDPLFGGVNPEPIPENLAAAQQALATGRFDFALASDGDGDRLGVLDASGRFVTPHRVLALLAESLTVRGRIRGGIAKTFSTSLLLDRVASHLGVPLHVTPVGFKHIAAKMLSGDVAIGGEESGGLGVAFHLPERDGVLSALLVLEAIAHSGGTLEKIAARQDATYGALAYGRRDLHLPAPVLRAFVEKLRSDPPPSRCGERVTGVDDMDGVKLLFGRRGWLLHRLSGTEPIIRIYAEHEDPALIEKLLDETEASLAKVAG
ncbi:MAG TPA: phosphoglucomutase/phosphomannomutase family protein [Thermoanaerobaculia bacterium]|nr:phosphoglucomutase/phosphomannomutase family protein [Thermoanaerobaculia bacterium]